MEGESLLDGAIRETYEEVGYDVRKNRKYNPDLYYDYKDEIPENQRVDDRVYKTLRVLVVMNAP